jgi:hypothetical protein
MQAPAGTSKSAKFQNVNPLGPMVDPFSGLVCIYHAWGCCQAIVGLDHTLLPTHRTELCDNHPCVLTHLSTLFVLTMDFDLL